MVSDYTPTTEVATALAAGKLTTLTIQVPMNRSGAPVTSPSAPLQLSDESIQAILE